MSAPRRRAVHGARLGVMMLDTGFERIPGDIGNAATWPFPVLYHVVKGATPGRVTKPGADGMAPLFIEAIGALVATGVDCVTTSCGFLAAIHPALQAASPVPVATSALLQIPLVAATLPAAKRVGVLTANPAALTAEHFLGVGAPTDLPVEGLPMGGIFRAEMTEARPVADRDARRAEVLAAADRLAAKAPDLGAIVLECTNLPPYAAEIEQRLGVPVYDIITLVTWFMAGQAPRRYS